MVETTKAWVHICTLKELPINRASDLSIAGQRLTITRCGDTAYVSQGFCSHMLFPLAGSEVNSCVLTCSLHRSKFDVRDGSVVEWSTFPPLVGPALAAIRERKALRTYETKIEGDDIFVLWPTADPGSVAVKVKVG